MWCLLKLKVKANLGPIEKKKSNFLNESNFNVNWKSYNVKYNI
jgi:hypothetical protein